MEIPEDVKRQAREAVANKETTAQIRHVEMTEATGPNFTPVPEPQQRPESVHSEIPAHVKRQAMDALADTEITEQIKMVEMNGSPVAPHTPSADTEKIAERIAQMHKSGLDGESIHQRMTKDNFGEEDHVR